MDRFQYVLRLHLPLATALFLLLPLTNACSTSSPQPSSSPQQSAAAPLQEPVESSNGAGHLASPLPAGEGPSLDVHQDNPTSRDDDPVVDSDVVHSDLYNAVANGQTEIVETLIVETRTGRHNIKVGVEDTKENTLLHVAAANGHGEVANLLLQAGASVNVHNNDNKTPVDLARQHGHESLAQRLERVPELLEAADAGDVAQVETLLAAGVYVNAPDDYGTTPLHYAAQDGYADVVKLLIEAGASLDTRAEDGSTALLLAMGNERGDLEPAKLLLQAGADPNIPNRYGRTPLFWVVTNGQAELVRLLLQAGADVHATTDAGNPPVQIAAFAGLPEVLTLLIDAGAPVNVQDQVGDTPLHDAALQGRVAAAQALIAAGARVNTANNAGHTPLDLARQHGHGGVAQVLRAAGGRQGGDVL